MVYFPAFSPVILNFPSTSVMVFMSVPPTCMVAPMSGWWSLLSSTIPVIPSA